MALLMVITVVLLTCAALVIAHRLDRRFAVTDRSEAAAIERARQRWRSANRGLPASRRRRREAQLAAELNWRTLTRADYHRAMSNLAAKDAARCPIEVPRLPAE